MVLRRGGEQGEQVARVTSDVDKQAAARKHAWNTAVHGSSSSRALPQYQSFDTAEVAVFFVEFKHSGVEF